jgi:hypothetical protein
MAVVPDGFIELVSVVKVDPSAVVEVVPGGVSAYVNGWGLKKTMRWHLVSQWLNNLLMIG